MGASAWILQALEPTNVGAGGGARRKRRRVTVTAPFVASQAAVFSPTVEHLPTVVMLPIVESTPRTLQPFVVALPVFEVPATAPVPSLAVGAFVSAQSLAFQPSTSIVALRLSRTGRAERVPRAQLAERMQRAA